MASLELLGQRWEHLWTAVIKPEIACFVMFGIMGFSHYTPFIKPWVVTRRHMLSYLFPTLPDITNVDFAVYFSN